MLRQTYLDLHDPTPRNNSASILIAADNPLTLQAVESYFGWRDCETIAVFDDRELFYLVEVKDRPSLIILDDAMERIDTHAACRHLRLSNPAVQPYIILISHDGTDEKNAFDPDEGPDDLLNSPFTRRELHARVSLGMRIIDLETELSSLLLDLRQAATRIQKLNGLLPICSHCKKIRDDQGYWNELEKYISDHSNAEFSHAICPGCLSQYYPDAIDESL